MTHDQSALLDAFKTEEQSLKLKRSIIVCKLGIILFPVGSALDLIVYPQHWQALMLGRLITSCVLGAVLALHFRPMADRHSGLLIMLELIVAVAALCAIITAMDGANSSYYLAIFLVLFAVAVLLPLSTSEAVVFCTASLLMYTAACVFAANAAGSTTAILNNLYFLLLTSIICVTAVHASAGRRLAEFSLKYRIEAQNRKLADLDRLKSEFFANVSHELRTPLTLILAPLQKFKSIAPALGHEQSESIATIERAATRLSRLVDDILSLIRLEDGKLELTPVPIDLSAYLRQTASAMRLIAEAKAIQINVAVPDVPLAVLSDTNALDKIIPNIITNAIKFTPKAGRISIEGSLEDDHVLVCIADTGIGIAAADMPHIFERFYQSRSTGDRHQGLGLGLALAKELMERQNGSISATSEFGRGTTFALTFPKLAQAHHADPAPEQRIATRSIISPPQVQGAIQPERTVAPIGRVLIVDDEPDMLAFLSGLLGKKYTVDTADSGPSGISAASRLRPDVVLLDYMLPGLSGLEICKLLKTNPATSQIKVIMLTARADEESKLVALQHGADDFLVKPFNIVEVSTRLDNIVRTARLERELRDRNRQLQISLKNLHDTEASLVHSAKLNSLGTMAAGLLHEIGNPLNFMGTALQLAESQDSQMSDPEIQEFIADLKSGHDRIARVVEDLRGFTAPQRPEMPKPFVFASAVEQALRFTAHVRKDVRTETAVDGRVEVVGSKSSITQVLVNLLVNAVSAVREVEALRMPVIRISTKVSPDGLLICIRDNGAGIAPENITKIFDPFFTTKDVGEGMGLGLSICHRILSNHSSAITVDSSLGEWTEFAFLLPLAEPVTREGMKDAANFHRAV